MSRKTATALLLLATAVSAAVLWLALPRSEPGFVASEVDDAPPERTGPVLAGPPQEARAIRAADGAAEEAHAPPFRDIHGPSRLLRGRLLEFDGRVPEDAWVGYCRKIQGRTVLSDVRSLVRVDTEGGFEIPLRTPDPLEVHAWSTRSQHTVLSTDLVVEGVVDLGTRQLNGGASLSGHVIAGRGLGELRVAELVARNLTVRYAGSPMEAGGVASDGTNLVTVERHTRTDADGAWALTGLTPGRYEVEVARVGGGRLHPNLAAASRREAEAPADGIDFRLDCVVQVLSVVDDANHLLDDFNITLADRRGAEFELVSLVEPPSLNLEDTWCVAVAANETYDFRVSANGHDDLFGYFDAGSPGKFENRGRLRLRAQIMGSLQLTTSAEIAAAARPCEIRLLIPDTARCIHSRTQVIGQAGAPTVLPAPAGRWELLLMEGPNADGRGSAFTLPSRQSIEILPHQATRVTWAPRIGGRCVVHIHGPDNTERTAASRLDPTSEPETASVRSQSLGRFSPETGTSPRPESLRRYGEHDAVLPAGPAVLTVESEGCRTVRRELVVKQNELVEVSVVLERN